MTTYGVQLNKLSNFHVCIYMYMLAHIYVIQCNQMDDVPIEQYI